ncbi:MAG: T9SS type A sorting domain-containing protein, partial [Bacteroidota bacterium]|nr:T9SS type A sorting domain-containing protein [Bacteroidota bacterium]
YDSLPTYLIDKPGIYTCTVYADSICGQVTDILQVEYNNMVANLGVDVTEGLCVGDIHILDATYSNTTYGPSTYSWNTGSNQPTINVTSSGIYSVTIVNGLCTDVDSIYVHFDNPLTYPLGPDANLCSGSLITLSAGNNGSNYAWSTGMFSQTIDVDNPGTYSVTVTNACGQIVDDIILSPLDIPDVDLGIDFTICEGTPENIDAYVDNSTYVWSDGQVTPQIAVFYGGLYSVTVTNECGSNYDEIFVYGDTPLTNFDLGSDTAVCSGFELDAGYPNMEYYWSNNETTQIIEITQSDDYGVDVTNACGTYSDFIHIDIIELNIDLGPDTVMCPGTTITLDAQNPGSIYSWSNGAPTQTIDITQPGQVWVMVTNICETNSDTLNITLFDDILDLGIDTTICENFLFVLDAQHPGAEYTWSTGETTQTIEALQTGLYALTISHYCGNLNDEIDIVVNPAPVVDFGTDTLYLPGGNPIVLDPQANGTSFIWSNDSTGSTTTALYPNTYSVTVTNEFGCEGEGSVIVMYKIGIDKIEAEEKVLLYPNPVQNKLFISFNDLQINEIRIYNSIGSLISQIKNVENPVEISTNNLAEGVYFVKIRTSKDAMIIKPFSVVR